jgi:transcriptional adapter 2-alpha
MPNNSTTHSINSQETTMSYDEKNVNEPNFNSCLPKTYQNTVCESEQTALNFTLNDIPSLTDNEKDVCITSSLQYHCDYCKKDISHAFRVKCAECIDFDLCVECFTSGVETQCHLNTHSYIPIGRNHFSLFCNDWNADEEIILLEGVSKYGFGNWTEVAELISEYNSVPKTKEQCETHYYDVHIEPFQAKQNHSLLSKWFGPTETPDMSNPEHRNILQDQMIGKYHQPVPKPLIGSLTSASCKVVGFMPLRGDFDVEYDNDAELVLSDIEFRQDETPQERELKLKVIVSFLT